MRTFVLLVVTAIASPLTVLAQEPPAQPSQPSQPSQPAEESPPTTAIVTVKAAPSADATPLRQPPSARMAERWHTGRALYAVGSVQGLLGTGLTLSSILVVAITGYPCNPDDPIHQLNPNDSCNRNSASFKPSKPTDAAPLLAYMGSTASAVGFVFSAAGLGYQHHLLGEMNADPGRRLFGAGTALGVLGFVSAGASYFFGFTKFLDPRGQGQAILITSITGTAFCLLGGLLYTIDASQLKKAWQRLSTF